MGDGLLAAGSDDCDRRRRHCGSVRVRALRARGLRMYTCTRSGACSNACLSPWMWRMGMRMAASVNPTICTVLSMFFILLHGRGRLSHCSE